MAAFSNQLEQRSVIQNPAPNVPFSVEDPAMVWVVKSGWLDLFLVPLKDGKAEGARRHVLRITAGQAVFGVGSHLDHLALIAASAPNTSLLCLSRRQVREMLMAGDEEFPVTLLEDWISALAAALSEGLALGPLVTVSPGETVTIPEQPKVIVPRQGIVWVKHRKGQSQFLGEADMPSLNGTRFFPVARHGWLQAVPESEIDSIDSRTCLQEDTEWQGLHEFHALAMRCLAARLKKEEEKEQARLQARAAADGARLHSSLLRLTTPIRKFREITESEGASRNTLLLAFEAVARRLDLKIKAPVELLHGGKVGDPVAAIARTSNVRVRSVALKGEWWKEDNGPLLAFEESDNRPVALLPRSTGRYDVYDPTDSRTSPVNQEVAARLKPFAYVVYRPFPHKSLNAWDLLKFGLRGCTREIAVIAIMGVAAGIMAIVLPYATGIIFDTLIPGAARSQLSEIVVFLFMIAVVAAMFTFARGFAALRLEGKLDAAIQAAVWDRLLSLPVSFFRGYSSGDLAQRSLGITVIRQTLTGSTLNAVLSGIFSVFSFLLLFYYSWQLALFASLLVLCALAASIVCGVIQVRRQREISALNGKISGMLLQFITGIAKFRVSGTEGRAFAAWARQFSRKKQFSTKATRSANALTIFNAVFPLFCNAAIFYCFYLVLQPPTRGIDLTTGEFLAFLAAFTQFMAAALLLSSAIVSALSVVPVYERARPIFRSLPEVTETKADPGKLTGSIEISNVTFRYKPDTPAVLRDLSLKIQPGQFVAFVGSSGSGKSTLFRLLLGFEAPESGGVFYDGHDLSGLDIQAVRQQIGVVLQSSRPINGSIFANIVGSAPLSIEDAWEAARLAGIEEDIRRMPMGMHTHLGDGGGSISGGQRQRLMIARAIVRRPRILLFDEATSALDNHTQGIVSRSLESLQATRVVIAHRLSTIVKADWIFVMDRGTLSQSGAYEQLLAQPGPFRDLAKRQMT
jgi:ATP-binding cassette subfamily C protein